MITSFYFEFSSIIGCLPFYIFVKKITHVFFISGAEIVFIFFIVLLIFGADKIPSIARTLAKGLIR